MTFEITISFSKNHQKLQIVLIRQIYSSSSNKYSNQRIILNHNICLNPGRVCHQNSKLFSKFRCPILLS